MLNFGQEICCNSYHFPPYIIFSCCLKTYIFKFVDVSRCVRACVCFICLGFSKLLGCIAWYFSLFVENSWLFPLQIIPLSSSPCVIVPTALGCSFLFFFLTLFSLCVHTLYNAFPFECLWSPWIGWDITLEVILPIWQERFCTWNYGPYSVDWMISISSHFEEAWPNQMSP